STVLTADGKEHPGPFPCFDPQTLGDLMDMHGVTWHYYAPAIGDSGAIWSTFDAVSHIRQGPDWSQDVISPETNVLTDVMGGTLAQVTWVVPKAANSDHLKSTTTNGPQWVASIVNAIMASPFWPETVIFITWDDWGGLYDHVNPPKLDSM